MHIRIQRGLVATVLAAVAVPAYAGDIYVVCNPAAAVQAADVRDVFLGDKQFAGAVKLQPADNGAAQADFLAKVLKMDAGKYATAWTKKSFRDGVNAPPVKGSDGEALEFVRRTPGACSYTSSAPGAGVTVVAHL
jgi:hypothetical protein